MLTAAVQMAKRGGRRKVQHRGSRRSYVSSAATEPPGIITTRSHVKGVKVCYCSTSQECHVTLNKHYFSVCKTKDKADSIELKCDKQHSRTSYMIAKHVANETTKSFSEHF